MPQARHGSTHPLGPLDAREAAKFSKYRRLAAEAGADLFPLAMSSFGGFGSSAMRLFAVLRDSLAAMDPVPWSSDPVADLIRELSIILQRGNTAAAVLGCQKAGVLLRQQAPVRLAPRAAAQPAAPAQGQEPAQAEGQQEGPQQAQVPVVLPPELEDV